MFPNQMKDQKCHLLYFDLYYCTAVQVLRYSPPTTFMLRLANTNQFFVDKQVSAQISFLFTICLTIDTQQLELQHSIVRTVAHNSCNRSTQQLEPQHLIVGTVALNRWNRSIHQLEPQHSIVGTVAYISWNRSTHGWNRSTHQLEPQHSIVVTVALNSWNSST